MQVLRTFAPLRAEYIVACKLKPSKEATFLLHLELIEVTVFLCKKSNDSSLNGICLKIIIRAIQAHCEAEGMQNFRLQ